MPDPLLNTLLIPVYLIPITTYKADTFLFLILWENKTGTFENNLSEIMQLVNNRAEICHVINLPSTLLTKQFF